MSTMPLANASTDTRPPLPTRSTLFRLPEFDQDRVVLQGGGVLGDVLLPRGDIPKEPPHDLARPGLGEGRGESDRVRPGDGPDLPGDVLGQGPAEVVARLIWRPERHERR